MSNQNNTYKHAFNQRKYSQYFKENLSIECAIISSALWDIKNAKNMIKYTKKEWYSIPEIQAMYEAVKKEIPILEKLPQVDYSQTIQNKLFYDYNISLETILEFGSFISLSDIEYHANKLKKLYKFRKYDEISHKIKIALHKGELIDLQRELDNLNSDNMQIFKTAGELEEKFANEKIERYSLGIDFLDSKILSGGIELNQLILISGDKDAGKTSLALQILENLSIGHKTCLFNLEFSTKKLIIERKKKFDKIKLQENFRNQIRNNNIIIDGISDINEIKDIIVQQTYNGIKFFVIDSQMCLDVPDYRGEEAESKKFQILHELTQKYDIAIFLITQSSKVDNENPFGSKKGGHYASIMLRIEHSPLESNKNKDFKNFSTNENIDTNPNERIINVIKNKQTGNTRFNFKVRFNCETRIFKSLDSMTNADIANVNDPIIHTQYFQNLNKGGVRDS